MKVLVRVALLCSLLFPSSAALAQDGAEAELGGDGDGGSGAPSANQGSIKDRGTHVRPMSLSAMAYLPWWHGFGIGLNARFEIPIVHDGFISSINDQISLEPSLAIGYRSRHYGWAEDRVRYMDITPALYGMWSFHITPKFRPYGAVGLGYNIGVWLNDDDAFDREPEQNFFYYDFAVGLFYNFKPSVAFRCELGAQGPKAGLSILF